jgi:hypothetical protein
VNFSQSLRHGWPPVFARLNAVVPVAMNDATAVSTGACAHRFLTPACSDGRARPIALSENTRMKLLSYAYRFLSNFVFLALVYFSLNFMEKYQQRAVVAILVLVYGAMRAASALRSFHFFHRIERLEVDARRLAVVVDEGPAASASRKQIVGGVTVLRRIGEMNSYIDLLFLATVVLLCVAKIVTD